MTMPKVGKGFGLMAPSRCFTIRSDCVKPVRKLNLIRDPSNPPRAFSRMFPCRQLQMRRRQSPLRGRSPQSSPTGPGGASLTLPPRATGRSSTHSPWT